MPIEHAAKVLGIDPEAVTARILAAGGEQVTGRGLMRRHVYDIVPGDMSKWIRLRDTGTETTLCVKEIRGGAIDGTLEVETGVGDFAATAELLSLLGFKPRSYQENRRTSFLLDGVRLELDEWPLIPPYLEIEGDTETDILRASGVLGFAEDQLTGENTIKVYLSGIPGLIFPD